MMEDLTQPRVSVIDDELTVRESLIKLLSSANLRAEAFASGEDFLASRDPVHLGCLITDMRMPGMSGIDLMRRLSEFAIHPPVILISGHSDIPACVSAMKQGAFDFLEKPYRPSQLIDVVKSAIAYDVKNRTEQSARREVEERLARLDADEATVLKAIVSGKTSREIAADLDVSLRTIEYRRARTMTKLGVQTKSELVAIALAGLSNQNRLLEP